MITSHPPISSDPPVALPRKCRWCKQLHENIRCPEVKKFEYYPDGVIKSVEYFTAEELAFMPKHAGQSIPMYNPAFDPTATAVLR